MPLRETPIPALYCVYLLRSTRSKRVDSFYVGSTPNPRRRLRQHNGLAKGGARRTESDRKRPWEMAVIVSGFPSKIAALQFEWAWQNTHLTRHIPAADRITRVVEVKRRRRKARVRLKPDEDLEHKIRTLQILLSAVSFRRWPLLARFYSTRCYDFWNAKTMASLMCSKGSSKAILDPSATELPPASHLDDAALADPLVRFDELPTTRAIYALDVSHAISKKQLRHSAAVLGKPEPLQCSLCAQLLRQETDSILVCTNSKCGSCSHLKCLAQSFIRAESNADAMLPTRGRCPKCRSNLQWIDLVRDLSLRSRNADVASKLIDGKDAATRKAATPSSTKRPQVGQKSGARNAAALDATEPLEMLDQVLDDVDVDDDGEGSISDKLESDGDDGLKYDASFAEIQPDILEDLVIVSDESDDESALPAPDQGARLVSSSSKLIVIPDSDDWQDVEEIV